MLRVLVLGGTGFLGSRIAARLLSRGHEVTILTRRTEAAEYFSSRGIETIVGDLMEPEAFMDSISPQDCVVFVAMPLEFGRISKSKFAQIKERTTKFVSTALTIGKKLDCPTILTLGTAFSTKPGEVADESWPLVRTGLTEAGEEADVLIAKAKKEGQPLIMMFPGQIYGPGGQFLKMYEMMKSGRSGVFGRGDNHIPRVHVDDCAQAFVLAVERQPVCESFIIADDTPCTTREFTERMAECMGLPKPRTVPMFMARIILGGLLLSIMQMDCVVTNEKAKRELGWELKYPSYQEGLKATIESLREGAVQDQFES
jgi:nucleoside-diphosphate-sugar epimerase